MKNFYSSYGPLVVGLVIVAQYSHTAERTPTRLSTFHWHRICVHNNLAKKTDARRQIEFKCAYLFDQASNDQANIMMHHIRCRTAYDMYINMLIKASKKRL